MQQVIQKEVIRQTYSHPVYPTVKEVRKSAITRFMDWAKDQEERRFLWIGISLLGCIGALLPATISAIFLLANNNFTFWVIACIVNVPLLVLTLAAQPTKVTIPVLVFAVIANLAIVLGCVVQFFLY